MKRRKKHTPKRPASARPRSKRNISETQPVRRPASSAPPPIIPVGGGYLPPRPKPLQMPKDLPPDYPDELKRLTRKIIVEAMKEFPVLTQITRQTQVAKLCKRIVSKLTPQLCAAVEDEALSVMSRLLHYFLVANCDELERDQVRQETMESDEWTKLVEQMAGVPSAAVNDSSDTHLREPKRRGRPSTVKRLIYKRAATYKDSHKDVSWGQLAKKYFSDEYSDDPKRCSDRVRMGVRRVWKAKRS